MEEVWKPCHIFGDKYFISNKGRLNSLGDTWWSGKHDKIFRKSNGGIVKPNFDRYGYLKVTLSKDKQQRYFTIHRLVALAFIPNTDKKDTINHIDGNKLNNCVENLEWMSNKENLQHAWMTGLKKPNKTVQGTESKAAKLTDETARIIKYSKLSLRKLSEIYGVHHSVIGGIKKGIRWPHVA